MIVLLPKQVHLQKDVGAVVARGKYGVSLGLLKREPGSGKRLQLTASEYKGNKGQNKERIKKERRSGYHYRQNAVVLIPAGMRLLLACSPSRLLCFSETVGSQITNRLYARDWRLNLRF